MLFGVAATAIYANTKGWAVVIPPLAWAGGLGATLIIGAAAGLLPALRAARMSPTEALWTSNTPLAAGRDNGRWPARCSDVTCTGEPPGTTTSSGPRIRPA